MSSMKALNKWRFVRFSIMKAIGHSVFFTLWFIMRTQTYFFLLLVFCFFTNWGVCINFLYISYLLGLFAVSLTIFITDLYFFIWKRRIKKNTIDHKIYVSIWFREYAPKTHIHTKCCHKKVMLSNFVQLTDVCNLKHLSKLF